MAWSKLTWEDDDGSLTTGTAYTAARMNNIELGIEEGLADAAAADGHADAAQEIAEAALAAAAAEKSAREAAVKAEKEAREAADAAEKKAREEAVSAETSARIADVDAEEAARKAKDTELSELVAERVKGPASSVDAHFALFSGTSGKLLVDSGWIKENDGTLANNSDGVIPSQKAVKTYVDAEKTARIADVDAEETARKEADAAEEAARKSADTAFDLAVFKRYRVDAVTQVAVAKASEIALKHKPTTASPRGVLVIVVDDGNATDLLTTATYGGVNVGPAAGLGDEVFFSSLGAEDSTIHYFFLGQEVPAGEQELKIGGSAEGLHVVCITIDGPPGPIRIEGAKTLDSAAVANPSVTLETGRGQEALIFGILHSGQDNLSGLAPASGFSQIASNDFGTATSSVIVRETNGQGGNYAVGWTATSDEAGVVAFAISQVRNFGYWNSAALPTVGVGYLDRVIYQAANEANGSFFWDLICLNPSSEYPWKKVGGQPMFSRSPIAGERNNAEYGDCTAGETVPPQITVPLKGDYIVEHGCLAQLVGGASSNTYVSFAIGASVPLDEDAAVAIGIDQFEGDSISTKVRKLNLAQGVVLKQKYKGFSNTLAWSYKNRYLAIDPIRVV